MSNDGRCQYLKASLAALDRCMQRIVDNFEGDERDTALQKLYDLAEGYCLLEEQAAITGCSIQEAKFHIDEQQNGEASFQELYDSIYEAKERNIGDMKQHPKFIAFDKRVKAALAQANAASGAAGDAAGADSSDDDNDLRVTEAEVNTIDPFSQQTMVSPVKNKVCGHSYEKTVVMKLLQNKKKMHCPYVGCPSSMPFGPGDLEEDEELKRALMQLRADR